MTKCPTCGRPTNGSCDACSSDPVRVAFARGGRISVDELRAITAKKGRGPRTNKFGNVPTWVDGIRFASMREARRYGELKLMEREGLITDLVLQPRYPCDEKGKRVTTYVADFRYRDLVSDKIVVEDTKGFRTAAYKLKKKLVEAKYGIQIIEV